MSARLPILLPLLACFAAAPGLPAQWQPGTGEPTPEDDRTCGVFRIEPGRAYFDRCDEPGLGPDERIGRATPPAQPPGRPTAERQAPGEPVGG